jgi:hypothetical protein
MCIVLKLFKNVPAGSSHVSNNFPSISPAISSTTRCKSSAFVRESKMLFNKITNRFVDSKPAHTIAMLSVWTTKSRHYGISWPDNGNWICSITSHSSCRSCRSLDLYEENKNVFASDANRTGKAKKGGNFEIQQNGRGWWCLQKTLASTTKTLWTLEKLYCKKFQTLTWQINENRK